jgi:hypothetical protein
MMHPAASLTKFKDRLRVPPICIHSLWTINAPTCASRCGQRRSNCTRNCRRARCGRMRAPYQDPSLRSNVVNIYRSNGSTRSPQISPIPSLPSPPRMGRKMSLAAVLGRPM